MTGTERNTDMETLTVADVALDFPQAIKILNRYHLDYCYNGKDLFTYACIRAGLNPSMIWREIENELPIPGPSGRFRFRDWNTDMLIDFIRQNHHEYIRITIPEIRSLLSIVCDVHGQDKPELVEIKNHFETLAAELLDHLPAEENVLFPAIRRLEKSSVTIENQSFLGNVELNILAKEHEHQRAGELLEIIRSLSNDYKAPVYACPTFQMAFRMLEEFEQDLMQHMHLENNVLFPKIGIVRQGKAEV